MCMPDFIFLTKDFARFGHLLQAATLARPSVVKSLHIRRKSLFSSYLYCPPNNVTSSAHDSFRNGPFSTMPPWKFLGELKHFLNDTDSIFSNAAFNLWHPDNYIDLEKSGMIV